MVVSDLCKKSTKHRTYNPPNITAVMLGNLLLTLLPLASLAGAASIRFDARDTNSTSSGAGNDNSAGMSMFNTSAPYGPYGLDNANCTNLTLSIPVNLTLQSERGGNHTFHFGVVKDQLFTPLMTYAALLNTLTSYERQYGATTYAVEGKAQLKDRGGRIKIPGFYDDVRELTEAEREEFKKLPFNETKYRKELGAPKLFGESGYSTLERVWGRPTLEINGQSHPVDLERKMVAEYLVPIGRHRL